MYQAQKIDELQYSLLKKSLAYGSSERGLIMDSLFALEKVPYKIINEIQRINFYHKDHTSAVAVIQQDLTGDSPYPANKIYSHWDTRLLKNQNLFVTDSSFLFELVNEASKYCHPVCITSRLKYNGIVSSKQGWRDGKRHNGVDIHMDQWDSVQCAFDGKVRFAKDYEGYGKLVVVRHYNGLETYYAHLAKIKVKPNQEIRAGDLIGLAGSTGNSDGSHLHFEVRFKDEVLNPENIIDFTTFSLRSDTLYLKKSGNSYVAVPNGVEFHIIERGDYPMKIANRYGLSLQSFCESNNLHSRSRLKIGDKVKIKCD